MSTKETLIQKVNSAEWWHVPPRDKSAYTKRGKFFASTFLQAEFYGRPNDIPEKITIANPLYGTSEIEILKILFPETYKNNYDTVTKEDKNWYNTRIALDAKMYKRAKKIGYDAIVLLGNNGKRHLAKKRKPHSIELNLCK